MRAYMHFACVRASAWAAAPVSMHTYAHAFARLHARTHARAHTLCTPPGHAPPDHGGSIWGHKCRQADAGRQRHTDARTPTPRPLSPHLRRVDLVKVLGHVHHALRDLVLVQEAAREAARDDAADGGREGAGLVLQRGGGQAQVLQHRAPEGLHGSGGCWGVELLPLEGFGLRSASSSHQRREGPMPP